MNALTWLSALSHVELLKLLHKMFNFWSLSPNCQLVLSWLLWNISRVLWSFCKIAIAAPSLSIFFISMSMVRFFEVRSWCFPTIEFLHKMFNLWPLPPNRAQPIEAPSLIPTLAKRRKWLGKRVSQWWRRFPAISSCFLLRWLAFFLLSLSLIRRGILMVSAGVFPLKVWFDIGGLSLFLGVVLH